MELKHAGRKKQEHGCRQETNKPSFARGAKRPERKRKRDDEEEGSRRRDNSETNTGSSWPNLSKDLLVSIMERLYLVEQTYVGAVCKGWRLKLDQGIRPMDKLPWTMEYEWRGTDSVFYTRCACKMNEPLHHNRKQSWTVEEGRLRGKEIFVNATVCASKHSWMLFYKRSQSFFFFFNPFTKRVIFLRELGSHMSEIDTFFATPMTSLGKVTFSSAPTSPDCFVFVAYLNSGGDFGINLYSRADKTWTIHTFYVSYSQFGFLHDVCYMKGSFYCCFRGLNIAVFSIASRELSLVITASSPTFQLYHRRIHLVECDGDLLLVVLYCRWWRRDHELYAFKLDWERKKWVGVGELGGRAIFLGETSFCVSAGGETELVANRVYYFDNDDDDAPKYRTLGPCSSQPDGGNDKVYGCSSKGLKITWIQPPQELLYL